MFDTEDPIKLIDNLLSANDVAVVRDWRSLSEREKIKAMPVIEEAVKFTLRTMYFKIKEIVNRKKNAPLSPTNAFIIMQSINKVGSKGDLDKFLKKAKIQTDQYQLSEVKPYAVNTMDILTKLYICISYNDAYLYVQVAKILRNYDVTKLQRQRGDLSLAHANISGLLQWYRLARYLNKDFFEERRVKNEKSTEGEKMYPPADLILQMVSTTVGIIDEMKIFPQVILKMLRESDDLSRFFLTVDALLVSLSNQFRGDEMRVRLKLSFLYIVRDIMDDTAVWALIV